MENLSIVIKEESLDKIQNYLNILYPILEDNKTQLIIINNHLDKINTEFHYTIYEYTQEYSGFKEFCFAVSIKENILILESGIELNDIIINAIKNNLNAEKLNYRVELKKYLDKEKIQYYIIKDTLIYNINSSATKELNIQLEDNTFINFDEKNLSEKIFNFIEDKKYDDFYLWYKICIFNTNLCSEFYEELEQRKVSLDKELITEIEGRFISENIDCKYINYLNLKKLYKDESINYDIEISKILISNSFTNEYKYFSYFILNVFKNNKNVIDVLKNIEFNYLSKVMNFLFNKFDNFHIHIYNFITSLDLNNEINKSNNRNALIYIEIIKAYMKNMSYKSENTSKKKMIIQMLIEYTSYGIYTINNKQIFSEYNFDDKEIDYLRQIEKVINCIYENDLKQATYLLKDAAEMYEPMTMATRYYLQKLIYENNLYTNKLSICMIVKNEEKNIDRCLRSITPLFDNGMAELIVVDTGSEDRTVEIVKKYINEVYYHPWQGDFSEARNYSISLAHGEYIFIMDADYEIEMEELNKLIEYFKNNDYKSYNTFTSRIKNFDDVENVKFSLMTQNHIFRNDGSFHYYGTVHNQPFYKEPVKNLGITILHYGYIMTEDIKDKKFIRTASILKKELEKNPKHIYYRYQLSVSYSMHGEPRKALEQINIYMKLIEEQSVLYKSNLMYYNTAGIIYYTNNLYDSAIEVFDKIIKEKPDFIDAIYFNACSLFAKEEYKKAKYEFEKYLEILKEAYSNPDINNNCVIFYSLDSKDEALCKLLVCYERLQEYEDFIKMLNQINDKNILRKCLYVTVKGYIYLNRYNELAKFYKEKIFNNMTNEDRYIFTYLIQKEFSVIDNFNKEECIRAFDNLKIDDEYLNILKLNLTNEENNLGFFKFTNKINMKEIDIITAKMVIDTALPIIKSYSLEKLSDIDELIVLKKCIKLILNRTLVVKQFKGLAKAELLELIDKYIQIINSLNQNYYNDLLLDHEKGFINNIMLAFSSINDNDLLTAVKFIKEAVTYDNEMARPMELFLEKVIPEYKSNIVIEDEEINSNEFIESKNKVKTQIEKLINKGELINAKFIIQEYEKIDNKDIEIYSMKAIILIMEGNLNESEKIINEGLKIDNSNFELLYNLAYIYESKQDFDKAVEIYLRAKENCKDKNIYNRIIDNIDRLRNNHNLEIISIKKRLVFFVKQGLDNFLDAIINELSKEYETKKVIVTHYQQIDEGMNWADICWFEWCDELIIYGSEHPLSSEKKIICRLHSYEAFTDYPKKVNWHNIDKLVFVAEHIREIVLNKVSIESKKTEIIYNGIDVSKYVFREKSEGFNIAYVGYINFKKGPMLLLHTFKAIFDKDSRYKLYIAGKFQDERDILYYNQMIEEFGLKDNVFYQGWQDDLNEWLEDKNYILCTSILESQNISVMQGMAKGIKPVIHNFVGAKNIYPSEYVWNTINDAINIIQENNYNSKNYRNFIENNYSLEQQINSIKELVK